jgi:EmrB/QacA subfamily drug resistance transporter
MINIALPYIGKDFGVSEGTYGWIVTGYSLAFGIFNAIDGRLADVLGMKRLYMIGILIFGVTSATIAFSPTIDFAIALRFVQGAGAAALPVLGSSIIAKLIPADERGAAMGVILSVVGVAASIGPFLGGFLVQVFGWRFVFAFTSVVLAAIPFAWKLLPDELDDTPSPSFDIPGAILLSAAVALGMYGFEIVEEGGFGRNLYLCLAGSLILAGAFFWWIKTTDKPFAEPELFTNARYMATTFIAFLTNATRFGTIVLVPIFLTEVNGLEPIWIGVVLFPGALAIAVLSTRSGKLADKVGPRLPVGIGAVCLVLGNLITAYYTGPSPIGVAVGMGLYGVGFAGIQSPLVSAASQLVPERMTGVGMGIFMMIFFIGGAFGTALSVTTVELQAADAASWLGLSLQGGERYSNGILVLTGLAVLSVLLVPVLPQKVDSEATHPGLR